MLFRSLIDADVMVEYLRKLLCDNCHEQEDWCDICDYAYLIDEMKKVPTVDAVEVVRCKDCKFYWKNSVMTDVPLCLASPKDDAFCSEGERREDETG